MPCACGRTRMSSSSITMYSREDRAARNAIAPALNEV